MIVIAVPAAAHAAQESHRDGREYRRVPSAPSAHRPTKLSANDSVRADHDQRTEEADDQCRPAKPMNLLPPKNIIASTVRNIGAVNAIAVTSASGICVTAAKRQNMLTVPDNERSACERQLPVFSKCKPSAAPGEQRQHAHRNQPAHEDRLPDGNFLPGSSLTQTVIAGEQNHGREFASDAKDGAVARGGLGLFPRKRIMPERASLAASSRLSTVR